MAVQTGLGVGKILFVAGAGYTSMHLFQNGKLSDLLGEFQAFVKGLEKSGDRAEGDGEYADAIAAQVRRLASEIRQLSSSSRQITLLNGNSGQLGNVSSLLVPAATLGALGYGYMWWKGISFSDFMFVTKRNMSNAVSNLTKHLEGVSEVLASTKKHLTQRIQNLDDKMLKQNEMSRLIKDDVAEVQRTLTNVDYDLSALQKMVQGLDGKITSLDNQQMFAVHGIKYLCDFVEGKRIQMPEELQDQLKITGKARSELLMYSENSSLKGLKGFLTDNVSSGITGSAADVFTPDAKGKLEKPLSALVRATSTRC